jgi:hypothetical protein
MNVKKAVTLLLYFIFSLFFITPYALSSSEVEDECHFYAKEEQVPEEHLSEFIQSCIKDQQPQEQGSNSSDEVIKEDLH